MTQSKKSPHLIIIYQQINNQMSHKTIEISHIRYNKKVIHQDTIMTHLKVTHTPKTMENYLTPTQLQKENTAPTQIRYRGTP